MSKFGSWEWLARSTFLSHFLQSSSNSAATMAMTTRNGGKRRRKLSGVAEKKKNKHQKQKKVQEADVIPSLTSNSVLDNLQKKLNEGVYVFCHPATSGILREYAKRWKGKGRCPWRINPKLKIGKNLAPS